MPENDVAQLFYRHDAYNPANSEICVLYELSQRYKLCSMTAGRLDKDTQFDTDKRALSTITSHLFLSGFTEIKTIYPGALFEHKQAHNTVEVVEYNNSRIIITRIRKGKIDAENIFRFLEDYEYVPQNMYNKLEMKLKQKGIKV